MNSFETPVIPAKEAMKILGISRVTLNDWCKSGVLEKRTIPGKRRVFITTKSIHNIGSKSK